MSVEKIAKLIKKGQNQKVAQQLQNISLNINQLDPKSGKTLLHLSIQNHQLQIFKMLLKNNKIKPDTLSKSGQSPLQTAILINLPQYIDQLLQTKLNPNTKNSSNNSIMYIAIKNKTNPQIIKKLIHHHYDINQHVPQYGSLLNLAIVSDQFDNFITLLENNNINLDILDQHENTGLLLSTKLKKAEFVLAILKKLLNIDNSKMSNQQKQLYINSEDQNGNTALHITAINDYQTIADIIKRQAIAYIDPNTKNKQGKTYPDLLHQHTLQKQKQKQNQQYQQRKRNQQKKIKYKQKQQQRIRLNKQQQILRQEKKKKKKNQIRLETYKKYMENNLEKKRKIWITVIILLAIFGIMYLVFLNAVTNINKDKDTQIL